MMFTILSRDDNVVVDDVDILDVFKQWPESFGQLP